MDIKEIQNLKEEWEKLLNALSLKFDADLDLQGILFLIGVQELGKGKQNFSKDQKQDLMHIATCRVLSIYGIYELEGLDDEGWPHWRLKNKFPVLSLKEQDLLLKQSVIEYFRENGIEYKAENNQLF
jgi:hypothetical protein